MPRVSQAAQLVKNLPTSAGDTRGVGLIPGLGKSPAVTNGNPLQYSCLGSPMDRGAWQVTVLGVAKSWTQLKQLTIAQTTHTWKNVNQS